MCEGSDTQGVTDTHLFLQQLQLWICLGHGDTRGRFLVSCHENERARMAWLPSRGGHTSDSRLVARFSSVCSRVFAALRSTTWDAAA